MIFIYIFTSSWLLNWIFPQQNWVVCAMNHLTCNFSSSNQLKSEIKKRNRQNLMQMRPKPSLYHLKCQIWNICHLLTFDLKIYVLTWSNVSLKVEMKPPLVKNRPSAFQVFTKKCEFRYAVFSANRNFRRIKNFGQLIEKNRWISIFGY